MELRLDRPQQIFIPLDLQIGMQPALQQHARSAQIERLLNLVEDHFVRQDVAFLVPHRPVERAEAAVLGAEVRVVDIAVDNVAHHAFGMELPPHSVGRHADADQIVARKKIGCFLA